MSTPRRVCVFCGSAAGVRPEYLDLARRTGAHLASEGVGVVYGGASVGLMGAVADAALVAGGEVVGVIPQGLADREIAHTDLSELHVVASMHERKAMMAELSGGFAVLPGGMGTLEELFEVFTWRQLGLHDKPIALLDASNYWAGLTSFLDHAEAEGFVRAGHRADLPVVRTPADLLLALS